MGNKVYFVLIVLVFVSVVIFVGCISKGNDIPFVPMETYPSTPSYLQPSNNSTNVSDCSLVWKQCFDKSGQEVIYEVFLGENLDELAKIKDDVNSTVYNLDDLDRGKTYFWRIASKNEKGKYSYGEVWNFTTQGNLPPEKPKAVFPYNNMLNVDFAVRFFWMDSLDPEGDEVEYDLFIGSSPIDLYKILENSTETAYATDLTEARTYFWKVVAKDASGAKSESELYQFTTRGNNPPEKPQLVYPLDYSDNNELSLLLQWSKSNDPDGDDVVYDLYMFGSLFPYTLIASDVATNSYMLNNLEYDSLYCWEIMAKDSRNGSTLSETGHFYTKSSEPPSKANLLYPRDFEFDVATSCAFVWERSVDVDGTDVIYDLFIGDSSENMEIFESDLQATSTTVTLEGNRIYYAMIRSKKETGSFIDSDIVRFTTEVSLSEIDDAVERIFMNFDSESAHAFSENPQFNGATNSGTITITASDTRLRKVWDVFGSTLRNNEATLFPFELKDIGELSGVYIQYGPDYSGDDENKEKYKNAINWRLGYAGIMDVRLNSIGQNSVVFSPVINGVKYDIKFIFE